MTNRERAARNDNIDLEETDLRATDADIDDEFVFTIGGDGDLFDLEIPNPDQIDEIYSDYHRYVTDE